MDTYNIDTLFQKGDRLVYGNGIGVPLVGRGTTRSVSIVAEISKPNIFVDMIKALPACEIQGKHFHQFKLHNHSTNTSNDTIYNSIHTKARVIIPV